MKIKDLEKLFLSDELDENFKVSELIAAIAIVGVLTFITIVL
jgi:hypothetical protein